MFGDLGGIISDGKLIGHNADNYNFWKAELGLTYALGRTNWTRKATTVAAYTAAVAAAQAAADQAVADKEIPLEALQQHRSLCLRRRQPEDRPCFAERHMTNTFSGFTALTCPIRSIIPSILSPG